MPGTASLTYDDLCRMFPEDNIRRELIDGELIVSASPPLRHQIVLGRLHLIFGNHVEGHGGGLVVTAPMDVIFSDRNVTQPDLLFVADDRSEILHERVNGAPSLAIEVLSPSNPRLDQVRKRDLYARFGVPEYWIVDPEADRVEVYRLSGTEYPKPQIFEIGETLGYAGLPGLKIDLTKIFRRG